MVLQGARAIAIWHERHGSVRLDLSGAMLRRVDLVRANLNGAILRDADLEWADFRWADLIEADLSGANLARADFHKADLAAARLPRANLSDANLEDTNCRAVDFDSATFCRTRLLNTVSLLKMSSALCDLHLRHSSNPHTSDSSSTILRSTLASWTVDYSWDGVSI